MNEALSNNLTVDHKEAKSFFIDSPTFLAAERSAREKANTRYAGTLRHSSPGGCR